MTDGLEALSDREHEALALVASGATDEAAAEQLGIAVGTFRTYLDRIRSKLGVRRRAELAAIYATHGDAAKPPAPPIASPSRRPDRGVPRSDASGTSSSCGAGSSRATASCSRAPAASARRCSSAS